MIPGVLPRHLTTFGRSLPAIFLALLLAACGDGVGGSQQDPRDFYKELVTAAKEKNGSYMYDVLDSSRRAEIDTLIGMQMANLEAVPEAERPMWDSLKGKSKQEIYGKVLASDPSVAALFEGDYTITKVDTMVVITVQHAGQDPNILYLRPHKGKYLVSRPPRLPMPPLPAGHPPMGDPHGAPPPQGMPSHGDSSSGAPGGTGGGSSQGNGANHP